ncbi:MAG: type I-C CRISPR-associated protein Cas8c/Csd1, partial [Oscillospiraceae bacterium]|nr:type I-C CRISPR-associated protein Cas8c/Csd1 [Oscillospiraceae bacterium]
MILTALAAYYDALVSQDKVPLPGWGLGKISFALSLSPEGEPLQIISTMVEVQNGKKSQLRPQEMQVPEPANRTVGVLPNLLFDNPAYILGFDTKAGTDKANPVRTRQCFDAAAALHISLLESVDSPAAKAIVSYFKTWNPEAIASNPLIVEHADALKGGGNLVFRIGGAYAHNDPAIRAAIHSSVESAQADAPSLCLVTGKRAPIARLHPKIKGVFGAQSSGASLVSFNAEAYNSWGKEQGANA